MSESDDTVTQMLCLRNDELQAEKEALAAQLDRAEAERDALAAHVERMRDVWQRLHLKLPVPTEVLKAYSYVMRDTPKASLARLKAEWQAEALDLLLDLDYMNRYGYKPWPQYISERAAELRRQAEEGTS